MLNISHFPIKFHIKTPISQRLFAKKIRVEIENVYFFKLYSIAFKFMESFANYMCTRYIIKILTKQPLHNVSWLLLGYHSLTLFYSIGTQFIRSFFLFFCISSWCFEIISIHCTCIHLTSVSSVAFSSLAIPKPSVSPIE